MFRSKAKKGPRQATLEGDVDVGAALVELDTDALGKAATIAAEKSKKEGKKKFGYLKRMAQSKFDEQMGAVAKLDVRPQPSRIK